jgi:hypothetical protein
MQDLSWSSSRLVMTELKGTEYYPRVIMNLLTSGIIWDSYVAILTEIIYLLLRQKCKQAFLFLTYSKHSFSY